MEDKASSGTAPAGENAAANATPAKKAVKSKARPQKTKSHPPTSEMVTTAIKELKDRKGSSLQAIKKYIATTYKVDGEKLAPFIKRYLKSAVTSGTVVQTKGKGASGSFKLPSPKTEVKPKAKKPVKKAEIKEKKPAEKKAAVTKKAAPVVKKPAVPAKKPATVKKQAAEKKVKTAAAKKAEAAAKKVAQPKTVSKAKKATKAPAAKTKTPKPKTAKSPKAGKTAAKK